MLRMFLHLLVGNMYCSILKLKTSVFIRAVTPSADPRLGVALTFRAAFPGVVVQFVSVQAAAAAPRAAVALRAFMVAVAVVHRAV